MELFNHQEHCAQFWSDHKRIFNTSDPGTGKTIASLEGYRRSIQGRLLVIAPLSILEPSWGDDTTKFLNGFKWAVAHGSEKKRTAAFQSDADIIIMNHDGVKWLAKNLHLLENISHCVVDEFTAFKNKQTQRSKALAELLKKIEYVVMLSGTPNSNHITDIWYPAYMIDGGDRLGRNFFHFRDQVCTPVQVGPRPEMRQWVEKEGAREMVAHLLSDITVRYQFDDCLDVPEHSIHTYFVDMPSQVMRQYNELLEASFLETQNGEISAVHAGSRIKKLLQLLSGAVYDEDGEIVKVHDNRYELVMQLAAEREQCVVAFNWRHEREALTRWAEKYGFTYGFIDGSVATSDRTRMVNEFQDGKLKLIMAHPQSAGHGLTLTRGTSTIWASPTYNAEHFIQFNRRIYRAGQTRKTETIRIAARDTAEIDVYDKLDGKVERMQDLLNLMCQLRRKQ
ncbi:DEAD/DEAH box helicase [Kistimonas scapharcae]|uniref:DEAD/DEAH box helicase n=1 Tax=Kistimonas scapharcae TaxID=1036133 RepID=A0ABP8UWA5_9GAMM